MFNLLHCSPYVRNYINEKFEGEEDEEDGTDFVERNISTKRVVEKLPYIPLIEVRSIKLI